MNISGTTGKGRAVIGERIVDVSWAPVGQSKYETTVVDGSGNTYEVRDYDTRFDVMEHVSDDGQQVYVELLVLDPGEVEGPVLRKEMLMAGLMTNVSPLVQSVASGFQEGSEMTFGIRLMSSPVCMYRWVQKYGDVSTACKEILKQVFSL